MKKQFLGTSDGQMVISNFRQPQIAAGKKANFPSKITWKWAGFAWKPDIA